MTRCIRCGGLLLYVGRNLWCRDCGAVYRR